MSEVPSVDDAVEIAASRGLRPLQDCSTTPCVISSHFSLIVGQRNQSVPSVCSRQSTRSESSVVVPRMKSREVPATWNWAGGSARLA